MRDEKEERKKQARSNKQTRQSNTAHMYMYLRTYARTCMVLRSESTVCQSQHESSEQRETRLARRRVVDRARFAAISR